jgi:hypothetical protein
VKKFPVYGIRLNLPDLPGYDWGNGGSHTHKTRLVSPPQVGDEIVIDDSSTRLVVVGIVHWACISDVSKKLGKGVPEIEIQCELYKPESCDPDELKKLLILYKWDDLS